MTTDKPDSPAKGTRDIEVELLVSRAHAMLGRAEEHLLGHGYEISLDKEDMKRARYKDRIWTRYLMAKTTATRHQDKVSLALLAAAEQCCWEVVERYSRFMFKQLHRMSTLNAGKQSKPALDEDVVQEARLALFKSAMSFETEKSRFSTYAPWWIRSYVQRAELLRDKLITFPMYLFTPRRAMRYEFNKGASIAGIATEFRQSEWLVGMMCRDMPFLSLHQPVSSRDERILAEVIPEEEDRWEVIRERLSGDALWKIVAETFPRRTVDILCQRFQEEASLSQVGSKLGLSRERIRQIEMEALIELKRRLFSEVQAVKGTSSDFASFQRTKSQKDREPMADEVEMSRSRIVDGRGEQG